MNTFNIEYQKKHVQSKSKKKKEPSIETPNDNSADLIEKLKEISLNSEHIEVFSDLENYKTVKKHGYSDNVKISNLKTESNKKAGLPKNSTRKTRKKDSFIVSDSSVSDGDGITIYHRVLTEQIKADVAKITPRRSAKKTTCNDDGIFTPYIIRRRSDASDDSDFSDKENYVDNVNPTKTNLFKNDSLETKSSDSDKLFTSISDDTDADSFKSAKSELTTAISPSWLDNIEKKDLSWCFSDKETSCESEKDHKKITKRDPPVVHRTKTSVCTTPVTYRLNNLKKLTPTPQRLITPDEHQESWFFLRSLSAAVNSQYAHPQAEQYKKKFKKMKEILAEKLFRLFNEEIFDNRLPSDTKIEWSGRMRSTSGFCYNKRIKSIIGPNNECPRTSRIVLSTKIIETPDRLRDTLIHEMCHAAAWIIDNKADGHGPCWKSWASKVHRKFPELPPIKRCHDYSIKTKFKYRCVNCGYMIGRHSKSLNLERKRCGYCYGKFELLIHNELKSDSIGNSPKNVKARPLSKFALFVKENYGKIKSENTLLKHGEIMKILSKNFAETKNSN